MGLWSAGLFLYLCMQKNVLYLRSTFSGQREVTCIPTCCFPFSIFSYRNPGMKPLQKSALNFKVHSQLFLFAEQLVVLKGNQISSQWKRLDIKSTWGGIQWNIWMNVRVPLLPTCQLRAGNSISIGSPHSNDISVGTKLQAPLWLRSGSQFPLSTHVIWLAITWCCTPLADGEGAPQLCSPLLFGTFPQPDWCSNIKSSFYPYIKKAGLSSSVIKCSFSLYISAGMTEEEVWHVHTGRKGAETPLVLAKVN